ncbi:common central domain of tyrosinase-domain-containing protein [Xylariaceae sp. FL0594]|nr:common central domain of tyrosinase-domain-containing protein [Xylariaceae sp. FL0594]
MATEHKLRFIPETPSGDYIVQGIKGDTPGIRLELREFKKNKDLWNLYLLGLWQFQQVPESHLLSYFQICGIHGLPYEAWPADDKLLLEMKKHHTGFCTHTSILFLSWHRPYLVLFERILQEAMLWVAGQFTEEEGRDRYLKAAESFRLPYWDWARADLPILPDEATDSDVVQVIMPESLRKEYKLSKDSAGTVTLPNPLYTYKFQGDQPDFRINGRATTTRWDEAGRDKTPAERKALLIQKMTPYTQKAHPQLKPEINIRERLLLLLQAYDKFSHVAHNQWDPTRMPDTQAPRPSVLGLGFGSFEDIHNTLHLLTGGFGSLDNTESTPKFNGHMANVPIAAFDPIFWLHHTNIDRLLSIWQALHDDPENPDTWVTEKPADSDPEGGTWVTKPGEMEDVRTPLTPFYKQPGVFWDSNDVRDTTSLGYAYPETKSWTFTNRDEYVKKLKEQILALYPSGSLGTMIAARKAGDMRAETTLRKRAELLALVDKVPEPPTALTAVTLAHAIAPSAGIASWSMGSMLPPIDVPNVEVPDGRSLTDLAKQGEYLEWLFNIKAQKHALGGQYQVHVFLGPVPEEEPTVSYAVSPYHVGTFAPLGQPKTTKCGKCKKDQAASTEVSGQIPLTIALAERYFSGELASFDEEEIVEYLKRNLHWEVVDSNGCRLRGNRDAVDGLLVGVSSNKVTIPQDKYDFPKYSPYITLYPEITTKADPANGGRAEGTGITEDNIFKA